MWVTSAGLNAVYRVDPASGAFTRYDIATPNAQPGLITRGPKGDQDPHARQLRRWINRET